MVVVLVHVLACQKKANHHAHSEYQMDFLHRGDILTRAPDKQTMPVALAYVRVRTVYVVDIYSHIATLSDFLL